ncbi:sel1 repeat family protein [Acidovorax sp. Be4]|uniref:Sel1 repeat family protein n=1 Tax=Acidovorax bellezanensis TaxID=2976702 RepID=A0ABT2PJJ8_9BURK|nr:tetratricopeptide repeat protein [Acidovorax sp. Be4]MCT9810656.1 sel1 repeat family protein [Acidovorax sp. Be4]
MIRYVFSACDCPHQGIVETIFTDRPETDIIQCFAERGDKRAAFLMGEQYIWGHFGKKDYAGAAPWYLQAARAGEPFAQEILGKMYNTGSGVERNPALAKEWFAKAAKAPSTP